MVAFILLVGKIVILWYRYRVVPLYISQENPLYKIDERCPEKMWCVICEFELWGQFQYRISIRNSSLTS